MYLFVLLVGYVGPPPVPPPGLALTVDNFSFQLVDSPFESWLQRIQRLWLEERTEQERRAELLELKINSLVRRMESKQPSTTTATPSTSSSAAATGTASGSSSASSLSEFRRLRSSSTGAPSGNSKIGDTPRSTAQSVSSAGGLMASMISPRVPASAAAESRDRNVDSPTRSRLLPFLTGTSSPRNQRKVTPVVNSDLSPTPSSLPKMSPKSPTSPDSSRPANPWAHLPGQNSAFGQFLFVIFLIVRFVFVLRTRARRDCPDATTPERDEQSHLHPTSGALGSRCRQGGQRSRHSNADALWPQQQLSSTHLSFEESLAAQSYTQANWHVHVGE